MKQFSKLLFAVVLLGLGVQAHAHNLNWAVGIVDCDTQTLALKFQVDGFRDNYDYQVHYELFDSSGALFAAGDTVVFQGNGGAGGTEGRAFAVTPYAVVDVSGVSGVITGEASLVQLTGSAPGALPYTWGLNPDPIQGRNPAYRDGVDFPRNGDPVPLLIDCQPTLCSIGDFVWVDLNRDGLQTGELAEGLGGITVNITDGVAVNDFTTTAADGSYAFTGLACDTTYTVTVADPDPTTYQRAEIDAGLNGNDAIDSDNHDGAFSTPTTANPDDDTIDFGYELIPASLGDFVWLDADQDGLQGTSEPGLPGVTVVLKDCNGIMIPGKQTQTAADGSYLFDNLDPGSYVVMVMKSGGYGGYSFTTMDADGNVSDGIDSDVNPFTGNTDCITLNPGEDNETVDAGLFEGAGLGNYVWHDLNADGIQNDGNTGIAGVGVELLDCAMDSFNPAVTTTTDALGGYSFNGLPAGCYYVMFSQPAGFDSASPTGEGTLATDSDAGPGGKTIQIDLVDGQFDDTWDAGFYKTASLGDRVWSDLNRDGLQDPNEAGLVGCTVNLQGIDNQGNNVDLFDTTDANGDYLFENLVPGEYMVQFSNDCTDNWVYTLQNANDPANDDIDSDANGSGKTAGYTLASGDDNRTVDAGLHAPAAPSITIEKATSATANDPNADDADLPTGPFIPFNDTVYWTYVVKNDGNRDLTNVTVMDDNGTPGLPFDDFMANCPQDTLAVNESMTCTAFNPDAVLGQYANIGKATGEDADQNMVMSDDPSHYFGAVPLIDIEKATNGFDADSPDITVNPIPVVPVGDPVTWTYVVTNTGNVPLTNIEVSDNQIFPPVLATCPMNSLPAPSANPSDPLPSFTCTVVGTAMDTSNMNLPYGVFENVAAVSAEGPPGAGNPPNDSDPSHYIGGVPSIDIEKATNGFDADDPNAGDAPQIAPGAAAPATYKVTNTGNVALSNVSVTDDQGVPVACPQTTLAVGESMICTASGIADDLNNTGFTTVPGRCGQIPNTPLYENMGRATGTTTTGDFVEDVDASHYCNPPMPGIDIEKATNGFDADDPNAGDAPQIAPGALVTWTYKVTNTGNVALSNVSVTDDQGVPVACPQTTLAVGEAITCTASGIADDLNNTGFTTVPGMCGQIPNTPMYENMGRATGTATTGDFVEDVDASHYCNPQVPGIDIEKATNGFDADDPNAGDAPQIAPGALVTWTYKVTNTGNVALSNVSVTDDQGVPVACPQTTLAVGEAITCTASGIADDLNNTGFTTVPGRCGQIPNTPLYENMGRATGTATTGDFVEDVDASHYCNPQVPGIDIEKATDDRNGVPQDADTPRGPGLLVGSTVNWTYVVTNTGNVELTGVTVLDDQPGVAVSCPMDTLAAGASMTCTASGLAIKGQYENLGSVTGTPPVGDDVSDSDPSHYFGLDPQIDIEKATNGEDADAPTGPGIPVGGTATFTYVVDNPSNEGIKNVMVIDDQGVTVSPVDINPADGFNDGDLDKDNVLDFNETWTYTGSTTVTAGQYTNIGSVTGLGNNTNKPVSDADPSNHFGLTPSINIRKQKEGPDTRTYVTGSSVTFTIVVENTGPVALTDVVVSDLKASQCNNVIGDLAVGGFATYDCTIPVVNGSFVNEACVTGVGGNQQVGDCDPSTVEIIDINISKEAEGPDSRTFSPGDDVTFAIVVTNTGSEDLSNVVVTDQLAPQCNRVIGPLAAGASFPYNCTVQSIDAGFENVACVEGSRNDVTVGDCDPSTVVLLEICELTLDKMCFVTPPPPSSNFQCDKPIDSLTMIWTGGNTVWVKAWKGSVGSTSLGVKSVAPGEEVTFTGFAGSPNDVFWEVFSDAGLNNKIGESKFHLSCSDDDMDGPEDCGKFEGNGKDNSGSFINLWKLEGMVDAKNTLDCTVDDTPVFADACEFTGQPLPSCENGDKPDTLTWRYDGGTGGDGDCADSTFYTIVDENGDGHDDFMCSGSVDTSQPITVTDDNGDTYVVNPGDEFTMSRSEIGSMTLSQNGSVVQTMAFHASCSQVLEANATAGALRLVALDDRRGDQEVQYAYTVTNNSAGAVSNIDVTDDKLGDIGSIASLDGNGGSMTLYEQAFITATTTNTAMAVGDLVGIDDCVAPNDSVTVTVTEPPKSCATHNKPTSLTFDVTGSCSDQDNFQDGKAKCTGPDLTGDVVSIVINKDANKIGATVVNGDTIKVFQTDKIGESLQSTVKFTITDSNGNSQYHEVHTSCSQPLAEGDLLGGIRLVVYEPAYN